MTPEEEAAYNAALADGLNETEGEVAPVLEEPEEEEDSEEKGEEEEAEDAFGIEEGDVSDEVEELDFSVGTTKTLSYAEK